MCLAGRVQLVCCAGCELVGEQDDNGENETVRLTTRVGSEIGLKWAPGLRFAEPGAKHLNLPGWS